MGTRRTVSARPPASGSSLVRATGDAHDPLESEADRLLAATCQRLGMLGVKTGGDTERHPPRYEFVDSGKAHEEVTHMRSDIRFLLEKTSAMEESYVDKRRAQFENYRRVLLLHTVAVDTITMLKHIQKAVQPPIDLSLMIGPILMVANKMDRFIGRARKLFPEVDYEGHMERHEGVFEESEEDNRWWGPDKKISFSDSDEESGEGSDEDGAAALDKASREFYKKTVFSSRDGGSDSADVSAGSVKVDSDDARAALEYAKSAKEAEDLKNGGEWI